MLTIWCNTQFTGTPLESLNEGVKPHKLIFPKDVSASVLTAAGPDPALNSADIAFGQPDPASIMQSPSIRWVHLTSAGYTRYDTDEFRKFVAARGIIVTNSSSVYAEPCAEHALAFMLTDARALGLARDMQRTDHSWESLPLRGKSRLMLRKKVVLLGFGAIGRRLVELLAPFSMEIVALRRNPKGDEGIPVVTEDQLQQALWQADHVINILPDNLRTRQFVSAQMFASMKPGAVFYNIGRGVTVDQDALLANLRSGHIAAAYLDVTDPEPLPSSHPLWSEPGCFITPHTAGGFDTEFEVLAHHFLENLKQYQAGLELSDRVM